MPITRTIIVDDDGSSTTGTIFNNAWKQELYNQIDAADAAAIPGRVNWTPVDASGAGLTLTVSSAQYVKTGSQIGIVLNLIYPSNADPSPAFIGGLPFPSAGAGGLYTAYGIVKVFHISPGSSRIHIFNATTGAQFTNAQLSSNTIVAAGIIHI